MQALEKKFGKKHPKLEDFKEPLPAFRWLPDAFFRLHRRRQFHDNGYQPLTYQEMADFADHVLALRAPLRPLFFLAMEETDNGVLYDHYQKASAAAKEAEENRPKPSKKPRPRK